MSFVPEKFQENPRMAPEKYGMYVELKPPLRKLTLKHKNMEWNKY